MTAGEIALAQAVSGFWAMTEKSPVVREPESNVYAGVYQLLARTDGLYAVRDMRQWPPNSPVFRSEQEARIYAERVSEMLG